MPQTAFHVSCVSFAFPPPRLNSPPEFLRPFGSCVLTVASATLRDVERQAAKPSAAGQKKSTGKYNLWLKEKERLKEEKSKGKDKDKEELKEENNKKKMFLYTYV